MANDPLDALLDDSEPAPSRTEQYLARQARRAQSPKRPKYADPLDALLVDAPEQQPESKPLPAFDPTGSATKTTTATTPAEARKEQRQQFKQELQRDLSAGTAESFGYGVARGGTLGAVDRLVGIGTQLGETLASANPNVGSEDMDAGEKARADYLANEDKARKGNELAHLGGEIVGNAVPIIATGGASAAAEPTALGTRTLMQTAGRVANSPAGRMAGQNFIAGAMNERSNDPRDWAAGGAKAMAVGQGVSSLSNATIGKMLSGAVEREGRGLVRDIMVAEGGEMATKTARKQLVQKIAAAKQEMRSDPVLAKAMRTDTEGARRIVQSKISQASEPRDAFYSDLDKGYQPLTLADLHSGVFKAVKNAGDPKERQVLEKFGDELNTFWIPKWQREGMLIAQPGKPMAVDSKAVREWVTKAQESAADAMGTIDPTRAKKIQGLMSDTASDIWQGHLDRASLKVPGVVKDIRAYDTRVSALLSMDKVLSQRAANEAESKIGYLKRHENTGHAIEAGGVALSAAMGHPIPALLGVAGIEAAKRAPATARVFNDKILAPLQRAAEAGAPWAQFAQQAAQVGIPQSVARALYDRATVPRKPVNPAATERSTSTAVR